MSRNTASTDFGIQDPQGLGTGGCAVDGPDPVIPAQQERQLLDGGKFVVSDEDVDHVSRLSATSGVVAGLGLGHAHGDQGSFAGCRVDDEPVLLPVDLAQPGIDVAQSHVVPSAVPGEHGPQLLRVHPHAVVLDGHFGERAGVIRRKW